MKNGDHTLENNEFNKDTTEIKMMRYFYNVTTTYTTARSFFTTPISMNKNSMSNFKCPTIGKPDMMIRQQRIRLYNVLIDMICDKILSTKLEYISTSYIISDNKLDMITWGGKKC